MTDQKPLLDSKEIKHGCCGGEFRCSRLGFGYHEPDDIVSCQWSRPSVAYAVYRVLAAAYMSVWIVIYWVNQFPKLGFTVLLYFTEWSYDLLVISLVMRAVLACMCSSRQKEEKPAFSRMTWFLKLTWFMYNVTASAALVITIAYWLFIYEAGVNDSPTAWAWDIHRHVVQTALVLIDIFFTATPIRLYHAIYTIIYGVIFILFSAVFNLTGNPPIYAYLDWQNEPATAALFGFGLAFGLNPIMWLLIYGLFRIRLAVYGCCAQKGKSVKEVASDAEKANQPQSYKSTEPTEATRPDEEAQE